MCSSCVDRPPCGRRRSTVVRRPRSGWVRRPRSGWVRRPRSGWVRRPRSGWVRRPRSGWVRRPRSGVVRRPRSGVVRRPRSGVVRRPRSRRIVCRYVVRSARPRRGCHPARRRTAPSVDDAATPQSASAFTTYGLDADVTATSGQHERALRHCAAAARLLAALPNRAARRLEAGYALQAVASGTAGAAGAAAPEAERSDTARRAERRLPHLVSLHAAAATRVVALGARAHGRAPADDGVAAARVVQGVVADAAAARRLAAGARVDDARAADRVPRVDAHAPAPDA